MLSLRARRTMDYGLCTMQQLLNLSRADWLVLIVIGNCVTFHQVFGQHYTTLHKQFDYIMRKSS